MNNETQKLHCPACDQVIDAADKFCPHCGKPTGFASYQGKRIVEHHEEPAPAVPQPIETERPQTNGNAMSKMNGLLGSLTALQKALAALAALAVLALVAFIVVQATNDRPFTSRKNLPVAESFDSLVSILPKGSRVIARFPDDGRHALYYMNKNDGKMKTLDEVPFGAYRDAFVQKAQLSSDEKTIAVEVQTDEQIKYFKINTETKNIVEVSRNNIEIGQQQVIGEDQPVQPAYKSKKPEIEEARPIGEDVNVEGGGNATDAPAVEMAPATPAPPAPVEPSAPSE
ncbi:MAG: zinc ribbon domain-containing protein [Prevotella sp.]|nr:zinc ribbon domain-containing protein [Prevotella sp.]